MSEEQLGAILNVLYIEDEADFRGELQQRLTSTLNVLPIDVNQFIPARKDGGEIATQFQDWLLTQIIDGVTLDGVILDSDLSGFANGISKETLLAVFRNMGIPVCRYSKRTKSTASELLKHYAMLASEGAASILVPSEFMNGASAEPSAGTDDLVAWLRAAFDGFAEIRKKYESVVADSKKARLSPSALLSRVLGAPSLELDFLGYTGASLFFFGDHLTSRDDATRSDSGDSSMVHVPINAGITATKLGYWLYNYIIAFPGPILNMGATLALLGVKKKSIDDGAFVTAMAPEKYDGPFGGCRPLFFREKIDMALIEKGESGVELLRRRGLSAEPIYEDDPNRSGVYCIATDEAIKADDAVGPIDFIPGGASELCRISKKSYERWMPWLNL